MKGNLTELVFILDRSGSMHGLEPEFQIHQRRDGCCARRSTADSQMEERH